MNNENILICVMNNLEGNVLKKHNVMFSKEDERCKDVHQLLEKILQDIEKNNMSCDEMIESFQVSYESREFFKKCLVADPNKIE